MNPFFFFVAGLWFIALFGYGQDTPTSDSPGDPLVAQQEPKGTVAMAVEDVAIPRQDSKNGVALPTPLEIVNKRMSAYRRHDIEAFLELYDDEIEIFTYPDKSLGTGKDHLRRLFAPMFEKGLVQVEIHHQIAKDSYVVNHETVTNGDKTTTDYVSIYEVRNGLIRSVRFVRD